MEASKLLADGWPHRMQYLYDCHQEGRFATPEQAKATMEAYMEPENFQELLAGAVGAIQADGVRIRAVNVVP